MHYDPLNPDKARRCLRTLVMKINDALTEHHGMGIAHNDVRLANICFSSAHDAVLIDLDMCTIWNKYLTAVSRFGGKSCMYYRPELLDVKSFNGKHLDYIQLGWLVAWVLSNDLDYHDRKWMTCLCRPLSAMACMVKMPSTPRTLSSMKLALRLESFLIISPQPHCIFQLLN